MMIKRVLRKRSIAEIFQWGYLRIFGVLTSRLRLEPNFIIIGAQRCGTTSLFRYLSQHPNMSPSFPKETHFFSNYYRKGDYWYRSHFPLVWQKKRVEQNNKCDFITGEATPYYLSHPLAPQRIFKTLPNVLLIVLLRDPVDRAYSHYHHEVKMGFETLSFEGAIDKESERLDGEEEKLREDDAYRSFNYQNFSYVSRGIYLDQLKEWRCFFDGEQMLILQSEDFYKNPFKTLRQVTGFLGLPNFELKEFKKYNYSHYQQMDPSTRIHLSKYFEPHNQRLYEYLNVDFGWDR